MTTQVKLDKRGTAKYMQVRDVIYRRIVSGEYPAGSAIHSEPELVNIFGVSKMTIRQALTELEKEGLLYRRQGVGTFVNDPNAAGRQITVVLPGAAQVAKQGTMFKIIHGVLEEAYSSGVRLSIYAAEQCDFRKDSPHSGGFLFPTPPQALMDEAASMARSGYRVVVINREMDCPELSFFTTDHRRSAELGTEFLIGRGRRNLALVSAQEQPHQRARRDGCHDVLKQHGLKGKDIIMDHETLGFADGAQAESVLAEADGILVTEGRMLASTVEKLKALKRRVPDDVEIVTFNRIEFPVPFADSIHELIEPLEEYGKLAVRRLVDGGKTRLTERFEAVLNIKR
jgi:GntR family transcriptional regulator of arabinose operon